MKYDCHISVSEGIIKNFKSVNRSEYHRNLHETGICPYRIVMFG